MRAEQQAPAYVPGHGLLTDKVVVDYGVLGSVEARFIG